MVSWAVTKAESENIYHNLNKLSLYVWGSKQDQANRLITYIIIKCTSRQEIGYNIGLAHYMLYINTDIM